MNKKEIAELRRRLRPDKNSITHICGCYVNEKKEIISIFHQSMGIMPETESEKYLILLKRTLSGTLGKNLLDISFSTQQVADSEEHHLLCALRSTELKEATVVEQFYHQIIEHLTMDENYLILLAYDLYDVPYHSKDGKRQDDASSDVFSYILCSICPVKQTKPALGYIVSENEFHNREMDWIVAPPELGFLFPAFNDRSADLYGALYYTKDTSYAQTSFAYALFRTELPEPAERQKETFQQLLVDSLGEECSYKVVQAIYEELALLIYAQETYSETIESAILKQQVRDILEHCSISNEHSASFSVKYDELFGAEIINVNNLIDNKRYTVEASDIQIKADPFNSSLIHARKVNGVNYIMVETGNSDVTVNGTTVKWELN